jgi:hypothetical protein
MKSALSILLCVLAPSLLFAQPGFAETYDATAGFDGYKIENTTYGYSVSANKSNPDPNKTTRMAFESGADGTFWGITALIDYPRPAGTLLELVPGGDYITAETVTTPTGTSVRIRRWFPTFPGYFNNLAEVEFPGVAQVSLERLSPRDNHPGGVFVAGQYRTIAEPNRPVPFLIRSSNFAFEWWIQLLADIPPTTFAFSRLSTFSDGGCAVVFKKTDERFFMERFSATGVSLWRREIGFLDTVTSLNEGPDGQTFYTVVDPPFSGPNPTNGIAAAIATDGSVVFEKHLNSLFGQFSVFPSYILPLPDGSSVLVGSEAPILGVGPSFFVAKLGAAGQVIWKKKYHYFQNGASFAFGKTTPDKGFIFTGSTDGKVFLFKIDQNGVGSATVQYCTAKAEQPWQEWISGLQIGSIQNASGKSPYTYFSSPSTDLGIGEQSDINITAAFSYFTYDEFFGVWIDYNHDDQFSSDEMAVQDMLARPPDGTPAKLFSTNFTVPASAQPGPTRMRVIMQRGAYPSPCSNPPFGEVEDYSVNLIIAGPAPDLGTPAWELIPANGSCFTNPGQPFGYLTGLVLNTGPVGAGHFTAKAWLSPDEQFGNADDILWQVLDYNNIGPSGGANNPLTLNINSPVPPTVLPGNYHFFTKVDADNAVLESNEANNLFQSTTQIGAPDYFLQNLTGVPASLATGAHFDVSFEVDHSNTFPLAGKSGGVELSAFLSPDNNPNNGNEVLLGTQIIGFDAFNAAGVAVKTLPLSLPGIVTAGSYFFFLRVVPTVFCDQDFQNNTLIGPQIEVIGQPSDAYCSASGIFPWHDWIAGVSVANLANGSGKSPYSDFSDLSASLTPNSSAPVALTSGFSWTAYDEYWKIWIDYNHNGVFEESGEVAFQYYQAKPVDGTPTATIYGNIAVPASALPGMTRMRVAMKRGTSPGSGPCESFAFGEVEDYSVQIGSMVQEGDARNKAVVATFANDFDLFPNPAQDVVFLQIPEMSGVVSIRIFDQKGQVRQDISFSKTSETPLPIPLSNYTSGIYWLQIIPENGKSQSKKLVIIH